MVSDYPKLDKQVRSLMADYGKEDPDVMGAFAGLHKAASQDGALSSSAKELIALAIGITVRCDGCIAFHVSDALKAGATHDEVVEAIGVAILMGGGPSVVYGTQALEALSQFEAAAEAEAVIAGNGSGL